MGKPHRRIKLAQSGGLLTRTSRPPRATEVILDTADGLDWPTLCKCDLSYLVPKAKLYQRRGKVSPARRRAIFNTLIQSFELNPL